MEVNNPISNFNKYSLYALVLLCLLPFICFLLPKIFTSYFDAFDKLSISLWAALYSFYWLQFSREIKRTKRKIPLFKDRVAAHQRIGNREYSDQYKSDVVQLSKLETDLPNLERHFEFVNEALRVSVIVAAAIKIIQLLITLIYS